jgi:C4-dicarboxylate-specific signal transduction histidine kinase
MGEVAPPGDLPTGPQGGTELYPVAWAATGDGILRGLNHALSNRIVTLRTLAEFVGAAQERGEQLGRALGEEVERLEELLDKFRMLPSDDALKPEPIQLSELLGEVVALHRYHVDFRNVECTVSGNPATLPVLASRSVFTRALLILLTAAKRAALSRGETTVALRYGGDPSTVTITIEAGSLDEGSTTATEVSQPFELRAECDERGAVRYRLRVVTLIEGRRRTREKEPRPSI